MLQATARCKQLGLRWVEVSAPRRMAEDPTEPREEAGRPSALALSLSASPGAWHEEKHLGSSLRSL